MTADVLTQLQIEYNKLAVQFFSTFSYLNQRHPLVAPPEIPGLRFTSQQLAPSGPGPEDTDWPTRVLAEFVLRPTDENTFKEAQQELANDLIFKTKQIQQLIARLPGIDHDEQQQAEEVQQLAAQVQEIEKARQAKRKEMRQLVKKLDAVIAAFLLEKGGVCDEDQGGRSTTG
ncbi:Mediator of RNA polymerase II transcription subunit 21 [Lithohypha guttulata]|uniref:Mediator of RNA polymerase II transcription subunit 21 n=1 Tax=Lithohypha guttulata TaxID=1690604 RepID=A0AAN7T1U5_9EURO|nr:Mediator of RNA polymerase II transcription subunit 21 [Lithohypha guttulata]